MYELRGEKTLSSVLDLAGGILPTAALGHIEVQRIEAHQKRTMLSLSVSPTENAESIAKQLGAFRIRDGDEVHIFPIAAHNEDAIFLQGHVLRPGRYSYRKEMKLTDLIASYSDLLPEPAGHYAEIIRLNPPDNRPSVENFDLAAALAKPASAPKLQPLDTVRIFSRYDFEDPPMVWVAGEVRTPGSYRPSGEAHVRDAIYLAGGVAPEASLDSAQLFRSLPGGTMKIFSVNLGKALAGDPLENVILQPRDRILVYRNAKRVDPANVSIRGEVAKPGRYPLAENMRVSDLIRSAGGMKRSAAPDAADLTRYSLAEKEKDRDANEHHAVNVAAALAGDAERDVPLRDGDVLTIPQVAGWSDMGASIAVRRSEESGRVRHTAGREAEFRAGASRRIHAHGVSGSGAVRAGGSGATARKGAPGADPAAGEGGHQYQDVCDGCGGRAGGDAASGFPAARTSARRSSPGASDGQAGGESFGQSAGAREVAGRHRDARGRHHRDSQAPGIHSGGGAGLQLECDYLSTAQKCGVVPAARGRAHQYGRPRQHLLSFAPTARWKAEGASCGAEECFRGP